MRIFRVGGFFEKSSKLGDFSKNPPFLESNLDTKICYNVFYGQVIRIQRLTSLVEDFEARVRFLADILIKRGYCKKSLQKKFSRAIDRYGKEFQKWSLPQDTRYWFFQIIRLI